MNLRVYEPLNGEEMLELVESLITEFRANLLNHDAFKSKYSYPEVEIKLSLDFYGNIVEKKNFTLKHGPILHPDLERDKLGLEVPIAIKAKEGIKQSKSSSKALKTAITLKDPQGE